MLPFARRRKGVAGCGDERGERGAGGGMEVDEDQRTIKHTQPERTTPETGGGHEA